MGHQKRFTRRQDCLNSAVRPVVEALENRQLLSVSLDDGVLAITGTEGADTISVRPAVRFADKLRVSVNGSHKLVDRALVHGILVNALGGDDWVAVEGMGDRLAIPATLLGGAGNDTLGGAFGKDLIRGGAGDDLVTGGGGDDSLIGSDGDDRLLGGDGADLILGGAGNDHISTSSYATWDGDVVKGGAGADSINQQAKLQFPIINYTGTPTGYSPQQMRRAYGLGEIEDANFTNRGKGQAIAIVIASYHPTAFADLTKFSKQFGLPVPTKKTFKQVFVSKKRPTTDEAATGEAMLDIQWVHAIAPEATILLVAADALTWPDMVRAVDKSVNLLDKYYGGGVVTMSWGGGENPTWTSLDGSFNNRYTKKISFVASSGDTPVPSWPASNPNVLAVGGTTLNLDQYGNRVGGGATSETPWAMGGSGPSILYNQPVYQQNRGVPGTTRGTPDLAYNADPATGVSVYNSFGSGGVSGWGSAGGTSAGAPQVAAMLVLANELRARKRLPKLGNTALDRIYRLGGTGSDAYFNDITTGGTLNYPAGFGWDWATGWGSPNAHTLIPALAETRIPFIDQQVKLGGRFTTYNPAAVATPGGQPLSWMEFKGIGQLQGTATLNLQPIVNKVFISQLGVAATVALFGYDNAGTAVAGNPIVLYRYDNSVVGQGQYTITYGATTGGGTVITGFLMFRGQFGKGNKVSGEIFTTTADGKRIKNVFQTNPLLPTATVTTLNGNWSV